MKIHRLAIEGLLLIEPDVYSDDRGYFIELFHEKRFSELGLPVSFPQDNLSVSRKNVIRGLHFQNEPHGQGKLVRVLKGAVLDVAVDLRKNSPTFGKYESITLNDENRNVLWIPEGFGHGFAVLEDETVFHYKCSRLYNKPADSGIRYNDPELGIQWNISNPIVSGKDMSLMTFAEYKQKTGIQTEA